MGMGSKMHRLTERRSDSDEAARAAHPLSPSAVDERARSGAGRTLDGLRRRGAELAARLPGRRPVAVVVSVGVAAALVVILAGKRDEFVAGLTGAGVWVIVAAAVLQLVALLVRSEAWLICVRAAGGGVDRRRLYRASSMGFVGSLLNNHLAVAARIAALRRSAPDDSPRVPALIAAELPILTVEGALAAVASFTLVAPLGLPWWVPAACVAALAAVVFGLRSVAIKKVHGLWSGLGVMRSVKGGSTLLGFVLIAVFAQIARNWLVLHAVGVDASLFDATAVLIAMVSLAQLPIGPSVGAASALLILGPEGVAAVAAAGVLLTATGTVGGLAFAAWAGADLALRGGRATKAATGLWSRVRPRTPGGDSLARALSALPAHRRRAVEIAYFGGLSHIQVARAMHVAPAPA